MGHAGKERCSTEQPHADVAHHDAGQVSALPAAYACVRVCACVCVRACVRARVSALR